MDIESFFLGLLSFFNQVHFFLLIYNFFLQSSISDWAGYRRFVLVHGPTPAPGSKRFKNGLKRADQRNGPTEAIEPFFPPADGPTGRTVRLGSGFTTLVPHHKTQQMTLVNICM